MKKHLPATLEIYALPSIYMKMIRDHNKEYADLYFDNFFRKQKGNGFSFATVFLYQVEPNGLYNYAPWVKKEVIIDGVKKKLYDMQTFNERWWYEIKEFIKCARRNGVTIMPIWYSMYQWKPMKNNIQGNISEWSDDALRWLTRYMTRMGRVLMRMYLFKRRFHILSNEVQHGGDRVSGATIADFHIGMYNAVSPYCKLKHTICNTGFGTGDKPLGSDYAQLHVEHIGGWVKYKDSIEKWVELPRDAWHLIGDDNQLYEYKVPVIRYGDDKFAARTHIISHHNCSQYRLREPVEPGREESLLQVMNQGSYDNWFWSLDGNSYGDGVRIPGLLWGDLSYNELRTWCRIAYSQDINVMLGVFPMSIFKWEMVRDKMVLVEDLDLLDSEYVKIPQEEWEKV